MHSERFFQCLQWSPKHTPKKNHESPTIRNDRETTAKRPRDDQPPPNTDCFMTPKRPPKWPPNDLKPGNACPETTPKQPRNDPETTPKRPRNNPKRLRNDQKGVFGHVLVVLGSFWGRFGVVSGSFRGSFRGRFGVVSGSFWPSSVPTQKKPRERIFLVGLDRRAARAGLRASPSDKSLVMELTHARCFGSLSFRFPEAFPSACQALAALSKDKENAKRGQLWKDKHRVLREKLGVKDEPGRGMERWTSSHEVLGVTAGADRVLDAIDLCHSACSLGSKDGEGAALRGPIVLDVSQDMSRRPWSVGQVPTMTRTSEFFLYHQSRLATGGEHLRLLGFNSESLDFGRLSPGQLKDLAGDGMGVPCVSVVTCAVAHVLQSQQCVS